MKNIFSSLDGAVKYLVGFVLTLVFRLITPSLGWSNISPLMATQLTGSKVYGPWVAAIYGALSITLPDLMVEKVGSWTFFTAICYGAVGVLGAYFLKNRPGTAQNFIIVSIVGTLLFDLVTGVMMGPLMFGQTWMSSMLGQIPFTIKHLAGNIFFAGFLAPWFYRKIMSNPKLNLSYITKNA